MTDSIDLLPMVKDYLACYDAYLAVAARLDADKGVELKRQLRYRGFSLNGIARLPGSPGLAHWSRITNGKRPWSIQFAKIVLKLFEEVPLMGSDDQE